MTCCTILTFSPMETALWRAVCAKSTCTVRREGRLTSAPTPIQAYRQKFGALLSTAQRRAMRAIQVCRTAALGGHVEVCDRCGHQRIWYNSCSDRHCPKCQSLARAEWIQDRQSELLETGHDWYSARPLMSGNNEPLCTPHAFRFSLSVNGLYPIVTRTMFCGLNGISGCLCTVNKPVCAGIRGLM